MNLEGRIRIVVARCGDQVTGAALESSRPQLAHRIMAGRSPVEVAELAGLLFSLCGRAQRTAAQLACAAASDGDHSGTPPDRVVLAEWAREHAWRLVLDWPQTSGQKPDATGLQSLHQAGDDAERLAQALDAMLAEQLLGEVPERWLARNGPGFQSWLAGGSAAAALFDTPAGAPAPDTDGWLPPLPAMTDTDVAGLARQALDDITFCAQPLWHDHTAETGALARTRDQPLVREWLARRGPDAEARLLARLVELAELPARLRAGDAAVSKAWPLGDGIGVAAVDTSRGLLLHVARLDGGRVADYRIVSPTEWNFHPAGALAEALRRLPADDRLERRARRLALAFDPCVDYGIEITEAEHDHA
jgi:hypothetical protein